MSDRGVHLAIDASSPAWATVASGAVEQLVDNLVDNALSVSRPGGTVTIRVESHEQAGRVELHVVDEGPGLDPRDRQRAFDRFWRAPDAPSGGSGLGLAIVRRLAEVSGGTRGASRSARAEASTPSCALPLGRALGADDAARQPSNRRAPVVSRRTCAVAFGP